jgi:hypothetical protein
MNLLSIAKSAPLPEIIAFVAMVTVIVWLLRNPERNQVPDFKNTGDFVLGAEAWCSTHPDGWTPQRTAKPVPGITDARRRHIEGLARSAARMDFADNGWRRANPYVRHSREACLWSIAYSEAWTGHEIAAHATADSPR